MPQDTGFNAFFQAITTSPEFKSAVTKDWKGDSMDALEKSLLDMQSGVAKASDIMKNLDATFEVPPAEVGSPNLGTGTKNPPKTGNPTDEQEIPPLEVQHFIKKDDATWGFSGVAGMEDLKQELRDSFIKPLKFKFLVERMRKGKVQNKNQGITENGGSGVETVGVRGEIQNGGAERTSFSTPETFDIFSHKSIVNDIGKNTDLLEKLYIEYEKFKISIPTGMLFYGPPGTGKTFITKKLAEELECGFVAKNMGEFGSSYLHQTTKNIKDFFAGAKKAAENEPIILFLDEIDSLVSARTNNVDANKTEEVSQFLQEFNGLESAPNLIVIAATNRPDHLDSAILRSGRLDKKIYLGPPDDIARKALFEMYIDKKGRPHGKLDYDELSKLTKDYVSADIETICDEVARDASQNLLELIDEAESGTLPENFAKNTEITMKSLRATIAETPSSIKMVDMSIYESWLEKIK